jgi:hypothetical protein
MHPTTSIPGEALHAIQEMICYDPKLSVQDCIELLTEDMNEVSDII